MRGCPSNGLSLGVGPFHASYFKSNGKDISHVEISGGYIAFNGCKVWYPQEAQDIPGGESEEAVTEEVVEEVVEDEAVDGEEVVEEEEKGDVSRFWVEIDNPPDSDDANFAEKRVVINVKWHSGLPSWKDLKEADPLSTESTDMPLEFGVPEERVCTEALKMELSSMDYELCLITADAPQSRDSHIVNSSSMFLSRGGVVFDPK